MAAGTSLPTTVCTALSRGLSFIRSVLSSHQVLAGKHLLMWMPSLMLLTALNSVVGGTDQHAWNMTSAALKVDAAILQHTPTNKEGTIQHDHKIMTVLVKKEKSMCEGATSSFVCQNSQRFYSNSVTCETMTEDSQNNTSCRNN
jgi:hypothetical protein